MACLYDFAWVVFSFWIIHSQFLKISVSSILYLCQNKVQRSESESMGHSASLTQCVQHMCISLFLWHLWWLLVFKWDGALPHRNGMFYGVARSACRCLADVWMRPRHSPYCCDSLKGICVGACVSTIQIKRELWGKDRICSLFLSPSLSFSLSHHAWRVVKDRMQAEGQQIDYPVCRKCVQGLCRQAGNK